MAYKFRNFLTRLSSINYKNLSTSAAEVRIVEVGPRDGLQNESINVPTDVKVDFINRLSETGLKTIEVTSFVSAKWVPQMSDNTQVYSRINKIPSVDYPVLIPNVKGLESALSVGVKEIAVFASASEGFARKNTNCSIDEGLQRIKDVVEVAKKNSLKIRGYISCIVGCPYDGYIQPSVVARITEELLNLGCYEISLGDTIGIGTTKTMKDMLQNVLTVSTPEKLAIHCHDTYGQALVNICTALDSKTFTVSYGGKTAGLTLDWNLGFSLHEAESKIPVWQYKFSQLRGSSDDGKSKLKLHFQDTETRAIETKELECSILQSLLFCMHAFLTAKVASVDPTFLCSMIP